MTQTLIFQNPGEIDIRGACIAGLSAKESKSPIGYFGTGLKYAIASILRWNGSIDIYSGISKYTFEIEELSFRGQYFNQITMNGDKLGFTTEYGKDWKPWQVFRELYANARDEEGVAYLDDLSSSRGEGFTHVLVKGVPELIKCFYERDEIILPIGKKWSHESTTVQFSSAPAAGIYYRGVRVHEQGCLYTWNFLSEMQLTEDRSLTTLMSPSHYFDTFLLTELHDIEVVMRILSLKYEKNALVISKVVERDGEPVTHSERPVECMFMDWFYMPSQVMEYHSEEFKEACKRLYQRDPTTYHKLRPYVKSIDSKLVEDKLHCMNRREQQMFDRAKELVSIFGFKEEISTLTINVQELGGSTLGLYEHGSIYLSPKLFDQGTKQLVATLYEECYHHRTANVDCTYNMQTDLFNIIISLNEELNGVIC